MAFIEADSGMGLRKSWDIGCIGKKVYKREALPAQVYQTAGNYAAVTRAIKASKSACSGVRG